MRGTTITPARRPMAASGWTADLGCGYCAAAVGMSRRSYAAARRVLNKTLVKQKTSLAFE